MNSGASVALMWITYGDTGFVAVGENGVVIRSLDGVNWMSSGDTGADWLYGVVSVVDKVIAVGL